MERKERGGEGGWQTNHFKLSSTCYLIYFDTILIILSNYLSQAHAGGGVEVDLKRSILL